LTKQSPASPPNENTSNSETTEIFSENDKLVVWEIPIVQIFNLVHWPDGCKTVPTFEQLEDTLNIVEGYKQSPEEYDEPDKKAIEEWLKKNSLTKFKKAYIEAVQEHERLENIKHDWFRDNKLFPQQHMRTDN
jgi:hypothetical protein